MSIADLPPGVHPRDRSVANPDTETNNPVGPEATSPLYQQGRKPFGVKNSKALAVFQRSASEWAGRNWTISQSVQIYGRQVGRESVLLWVPSGATHGVAFGSSEADALDKFAPVLNPGDTPVEIASEAAVWVAPISGETSGTVYSLSFWNPAVVEPGT